MLLKIQHVHRLHQKQRPGRPYKRIEGFSVSHLPSGGWLYILKTAKDTALPSKNREYQSMGSPWPLMYFLKAFK